jgi:hypothetical protein
MRRVVALVAALVLVMSLVPAVAAKQAGTTTPVSGTWTWVNTGAVWTDLPDGSQQVVGEEAGSWTGSFQGTSHDEFVMTFQPPLWTSDALPWGPAEGSLTASFDGLAGDKNGTMVMEMTIVEAANTWVMTGSWTIASGTGALKHVSGSGSWYCSGMAASATYWGSITWR